MELSTAIEFIRQRRQGVLATIRSNGMPQLSNILYIAEGGAGSSGSEIGASSHYSIDISITDSRAKTKNLRRDPRSSLYVVGDNFWQYVVLECNAELSPVAHSVDDETVERLVGMYRIAAGEHPDWKEFRQVMVSEQRLVLTLRPERAYGLLS